MTAEEQPTGRTRYRTQSRAFRPDTLVLQVEVAHADGPSDSWGLPTYLAGRFWRDARVEDLVFIGAQKAAAQDAAQKADTARGASFAEPLFVVWIDCNCGQGSPDWAIDNLPGRENEPLGQALAHSAGCKARGFPSVLALPGQTPRPDGTAT